ncbi:MAG: hypothetical protein KGJ23_00055 [Euryarchaeota archaeon]|nr:hypothetical protein [Euryarchaeota archaeon]MDE1834987.1 hypothetical protein [Euryarchaeota archaeon]MDE1880672.1 hypothetical protein [Euryarchaeota archaeon]MDE2044826.1 hypothetical protein [Thermoplasmata archaeon]
MSGIEAKEVAERVKFVFGDVAEKILQIEEQRLGIRPPTPLKPEDLRRLAEELRELSVRMAGEELSKRLYQEIMTLASEGESSEKGSGATARSRRGP